MRPIRQSNRKSVARNSVDVVMSSKDEYGGSLVIYEGLCDCG